MRSALLSAVLTGILALPVVAHAGIDNGDFETGTLSGWTVAGSASALTSSFGVTPPQGSYQGYIETTGNYTDSGMAVIASLGVDGSNILALGAGTPTNGTGMSQSVTVNAGDVLSFDWNFVTDELTELPMYNDFAFFTISDSAYLLASRNSSTYDTVSPPAGFEGQTDYATQTYTFSTGGIYTVGFGTLNVGDEGYDSALLLDSISVPEPHGLALMLFSLGTLTMGRRYRGVRQA